MDEQAPAVSVLMTVWNGGHFLPLAVSAILGQTWRDLELVVVDNGSSDGAVDALPVDPRLRIVRAGRNLGIPAGTNLAMSHARGRYIAVVDQDDIVLPEKLDRQLAWLEAHPDHGGVAARARLIDPAGRVTGDEFTLHTAAEHHRFTQFSQAASFGAHLFRREVVLAFPRREAFPFSSDFDFVARVAERWPVTALPEVLFHYRVHAGQTTRQRRCEQIAAECMIRVLTWRRRAGQPEKLEEITAEMSALAALPAAAVIYRACIAYCRRHGLPVLAAYHARKLLGASRHPTDWLHGFRTVAALRADGEARRIFLRGPLTAYNLRPWPACG